MAITNLIALGTSVPTSYQTVTVAIGDPKTLLQIGTAHDAEYEIAFTGSDGSTYSLATLDRQDFLDGGAILTVPGTYKVRRVKVHGAGTSGLDVMDGS